MFYFRILSIFFFGLKAHFWPKSWPKKPKPAAQAIGPAAASQLPGEAQACWPDLPFFSRGLGRTRPQACFFSLPRERGSCLALVFFSRVGPHPRPAAPPRVTCWPGLLFRVTCWPSLLFLLAWRAPASSRMLAFLPLPRALQLVPSPTSHVFINCCSSLDLLHQPFSTAEGVAPFPMHELHLTPTLPTRKLPYQRAAGRDASLFFTPRMAIKGHDFKLKGVRQF